MKTYPLCLIGLEKRRAVVVGGGDVAVRKAAALLRAGAQIEVIAPQVEAALLAYAQAGELTIHRRAYRRGDLAGAFLAIAATDDPAVNLAVWEEASELGCLVNVVDDPEHSSFILPAVVERGEVKIAISTGGASPALSRRLREKIESEIGFEYGVLATLMAELRPELKTQLPAAERLQAALEMVDADILAIIRQEGEAAGRRALNKLWQQIVARQREQRQ